MENKNIHCSQIIKGRSIFSEESETVVPWWSFGKTVLATVILSLVRDGKLKLDDKYEDKQYTIRQLLQHTSGLPDYGGLKEYHDAVSKGDTPWSTDELLSRVQAETLLSEPGLKFRYSNIGYLLLKRLIEKVTGVSIEEALQNLLFGPLGISDVKLAKSREDFASMNLSSGQSYDPGWLYHGLLIGPLSSATLFLNRLFSTEFLPEHLKKEMIYRYKIADSFPGRPFKNPSYGLGLMIGDTEDGLAVGHTGQGPGSTIAVYHFGDITPMQTVGLFVKSNTSEQQGILEEKIISIISKK